MTNNASIMNEANKAPPEAATSGGVDPQKASLRIMTKGTEVVVWSLPHCSACRATRAALQRQGVTHTVRDLSMHPNKACEFKAAGLMNAPIVEAGTETWAGFRPDKIIQLAQHASNQ